MYGDFSVYTDQNWLLQFPWHKGEEAKTYEWIP